MDMFALSSATGVSARTIKRFIDLKLVKPPHGRTRAAVYDDSHRADVMRVQAYRAVGWGYERIRREMNAGHVADASDASDSRQMTVEHRFRVGVGVCLVFAASGSDSDVERWRRLAERVEEVLASA